MSRILLIGLIWSVLGRDVLADTAPPGVPALPAGLLDVSVDPVNAVLNGPDDRFTLLVNGRTATREVDLTGFSRFRSLNLDTVDVASDGVLIPVGDGTGTVEVEIGDRKLAVIVTVAHFHEQRSFNFENDIVPLLSKFGCNASGCHGKAEGQNGFKLSVFGFDPVADHAALTQEGRGRRVFPAVPERSLLLTKASGGVPHGGGIRIPRGAPELRLMRDWIAAGLPFGSSTDAKVESIRVTPRERQMEMHSRQQLRIVATYTDGRQVDVTRYARYQTNNETLGSVSERGVVETGEIPGDVAIMASYMGAVDVFQALIPRPEALAGNPNPPARNYIDNFVYAKLAKLNVAPSEPVTDADYLRRVFLDVIGTLPTAAEARAFLEDTRLDRRERLVEALLKRPEYADFWALQYADLLRVDRQVLGHRGAYTYYRWIRDSFATHKPFDQFVREIVAADGPLAETPGGHLFKVVTKPGDMAGALSQVFLGVRIDCAQCHHHPYDRWSQTDYAGMQAFFTQVSFKKVPQGEILIAQGTPETRHPRTNEPVFAHALGTAMPEANPEGDRRKVLAAWMTAPDNPFFARSVVNRTWAHFMGRGLVEPVDDMRLTNPPSNPELLNALADDFVKHGFSFPHLIQSITASQVYQLSCRPNASNERDVQNYSRMTFKRLPAEVLFDAVCQTTGVSEKFEGVPSGYRAIQLWDSKVPHYFLKLFGRPMRVTSCECERTVEPSVAQVLHVMNSPEIQAKLAHAAGTLSHLVHTYTDDARLLDELYLTFYSRFPTADERQVALEYLQSHVNNRRQAAEDIAWGMLNTVEFLFNH